MQALTKTDQSTLAMCEDAIEGGVKAVGENLLKIREQKLYRATHDTFQEYCQGRWGFKRNYANKLILAAKTRGHLGTIVPTSDVPSKESHLREIAKASEEQQAQVLEAGQQLAAAEEREPVAADYAEGRKIVEGDRVVTDDPEYDAMINAEIARIVEKEEHIDRLEERERYVELDEQPNGSPAITGKLAQELFVYVGRTRPKLDALNAAMGGKNGHNYQTAREALTTLIDAVDGMRDGVA